MKKKIIFFLANFNQGGAGQSITRLCLELNKKKYDVTVLCLQKCYYKNILKKYKIEVKEINKIRVSKIREDLTLLLNSYSLKYEKIIFVSNLFYTNALISIFLKKDEKIKLVFVERTPLQELSIYFGLKDFLKKFLIKLILKFNYKKASIVVSNSKKTAYDISNFAKCRSIHIYPPSFNLKINFNKSRSSKLNILSIGRLSKEKNFEELILFLSKLNNLNFSLNIIGSGPQKIYLRKLIKTHNLQNKIRLLGFKTNTKKYFKKTNLFISPSKFEGFPNVIVESISHGVPVLSNQSHGGVNEIINKKFGMIYSNFETFQNEIQNFTNNQEKFRFKKKDIKNHFRKFSIHECTKNYEKLFDKL